MGLIQQIVGGGLQGLGTGLTQQAAHKRRMDGMRLREMYFAKRQEKQQVFQAEQGDLGRDLRATEGAANRDLRATEGEASRDLRVEEGAANRDLRRTEREADREFRESEGDKRRTLMEKQHRESMGVRHAQVAQTQELLGEKVRALKLQNDVNTVKLANAVEKSKGNSGPEPLKTKDFTRIVEDIRENYAFTLDEHDEKVPDPRKEKAFVNYYQKFGTYPPFANITKEHLLVTMRVHGLGVEEAVIELGNDGFIVPAGVVADVLEDQRFTARAVAPAPPPAPTASAREPWSPPASTAPPPETPQQSRQMLAPTPMSGRVRLGQSMPSGRRGGVRQNQ